MDAIKTPSPLADEDEAIFKEIATDTAVALGNLADRNVLASCNLLNGIEGSDTGGIKPERINISLYFSVPEESNQPSLTAKKSKRVTGPPLAKPLTGLTATLYNPGQLAWDRELRELERSLLAKGPPRQPLARLQPPLGVSVGSESHFWVRRDEAMIDVVATCKYVGESCYIFVDNEAPTDILDEEFVAVTVAFFDQTAYPKDTEMFGSATDTDHDPRIFILFSQLSAGEGWRTLGYFYAIDKFPSNTGAEYYYSNEHDLFYLTIPSDASDLQVFQNTLAHEFQHMINFDRHWANDAPSEKVWLNETLSELAGFLCTQDISSRLPLLQNFLDSPLVGLTVWNYKDSVLNLKNYAAANLFGVYLYDRFYLNGNDSKLMQKLVNNILTGIENVQDVTGVSFDLLFKDWNLALIISNTTIDSNFIYQYRSINLRADGLNGLYVFKVNMSYDYYQDVYAYTPLVVWVQGIADYAFLRLLGNGAGGRLVAYY